MPQRRNSGCATAGLLHFVTPSALCVCPLPQLDDVMGQAQSVSSNLQQQRAVFDSIGSKMTNLGARFPVVNSLLNAIRRKKSKVRALMPWAESVAVPHPRMLAFVYSPI